MIDYIQSVSATLPSAVHSRAAAIGSTWFAFSLALALALPQPPKPINLAVGVLIGGALIILGFRAVVGGRGSFERQTAERLKLAVCSIAFGTALGAILLAVMVLAVQAEPALRARFAGRLLEPLWRPLALAFESSILEETVFRLFALSIAYRLIVRISGRRKMAFLTALVVSTLLFGAAHLPAWLAIAHGTALLVVMVLALNGIGGLLFGWVFWRWGLPYAIMCHFAGDVVIQALTPHVLA